MDDGAEERMTKKLCSSGKMRQKENISILIRMKREKGRGAVLCVFYCTCLHGSWKLLQYPALNLLREPTLIWVQLNMAKQWEGYWCQRTHFPSFYNCDIICCVSRNESKGERREDRCLPWCPLKLQLKHCALQGKKKKNNLISKKSLPKLDSKLNIF